jgi:hypothetical protein
MEVGVCSCGALKALAACTPAVADELEPPTDPAGLAVELAEPPEDPHAASTLMAAIGIVSVATLLSRNLIPPFREPAPPARDLVLNTMITVIIGLSMIILMSRIQVLEES